jgi:predicted nucleic acid-binding protein
MTKNKARPTASYAFQAGEFILVDANVWLYLQPPAAQPPPRFSLAYSAAFKSLLTAKSKPVIDALVLSEYLNRYIRVEYDVYWRATYPKFKDFRQSKDFATLGTAAIADAGQILKFSTREHSPLHQVNLPEILNETASGRLDFNDGMLVETCRLRGWKLLTNDADMTLGGIDVLTSNPRLLAACPP